MQGDARDRAAIRFSLTQAQKGIKANYMRVTRHEQEPTSAAQQITTAQHHPNFNTSRQVSEVIPFEQLAIHALPMSMRTVVTVRG